MRITVCLGLLAYMGLCSALNHHIRNHDTHDYYALHLRPQTLPEQVALALGLKYEGPLGELPDHHTFSSPRSTDHPADRALEDLRKRRRKRDASSSPGILDSILWSQKQKLKPKLEKRAFVPSILHRASEADQQIDGRPVAVEAAVAIRREIASQLDIRDPIFNDQWHLFNTIQLGHDINVTGVWTQGITGHNTTVVMVDDGIDMDSEDLKDNYFAEGSYDFNDKSEEPRPRLSDDRHGTRCAGEIAAVKNGVCGVGVAYNAKIGGLRILSKVITDEDEAVAMNYKFQKNQIYSCSWGPPDDGRSMDAPGILIKRAIVNAIQNGRQGRGTIYVFAAGNGAGSGDNCNFDGYTNSIYSITVGAIDRKGLHPYYSEKCSAQLVVTYSSGSGDAIHTTDVGTNKCYSNHGGTSAAAPLGAGIFALALSVRPELTWRDLQAILVQTAVPVNEHEVWDKTYSGRKFSHTYGYGKLDAYAVVQAAKDFELLKPQAWFYSPRMEVHRQIPQGVEGLLSTFEVTKDALKNANLERIEHVTVTMNVNHTRRGDLSVELRSPANVVSHLSVTRRLDEANSGYTNWTFMSVAHWGEPGIGKWSVIVKDTEVNAYNGTFNDWKLSLWGECIDPSSQELLPMPTEDDEDEEEEETISAHVTTTTHSSGLAATGVSANPSDHIDRPINAKPTAIQGIPTNSTVFESATPSSTSTSAANNFLYYFPTFGVSKRTRVWIYGALAIIVLFCTGLGIYFYRQYRKRAYDSYEFDVLDSNDPDVEGIEKGKRVRKRAGELYDAFAGESDEELLSDGGQGPYEDRSEESDGDDDDDDDDGEKRGRSQSRGNGERG